MVINNYRIGKMVGDFISSAFSKHSHSKAKRIQKQRIRKITDSEKFNNLSPDNKKIVLSKIRERLEKRKDCSFRTIEEYTTRVKKVSDKKKFAEDASVMYMIFNLVSTVAIYCDNDAEAICIILETINKKYIKHEHLLDSIFTWQGVEVMSEIVDGDLFDRILEKRGSEFINEMSDE